MILPDEAATLALGMRLAKVLRAGDVVALSGPLGAGKTTLARGCLAGLGHTGEVASPTFTIVQSYDLASPAVRAEPVEAPSFFAEKNGPSTGSGRTVSGPLLPVLHVDLYRIDNPAEIEELGLDDALFDHALLVEWPERLRGALWPHALQLALEPAGDGARRLTAGVPPAWEARWPLPS